METIKITLELNAEAVKKIEDITAWNNNIEVGKLLKLLLETEINNSPDAFVERMCYNNY